MSLSFRRALGAALALALAPAALAGACNPGAYSDYALAPGGAGDGTGGRATGASCNGFYSADAACESCFVDSACCEQAARCEGCKDYALCLGQCGPEQAACREDCDRRLSAGSASAKSLLACLDRACPSCGGLLSDAGALGNPQGASGGGGAPPSRCDDPNACAVQAACLDCDQRDGSCETDSGVDPKNCGACGRDCRFSSCVAGQCGAVSLTGGVVVSKRLVAGGGYLYWVTREDKNGVKSDSVRRIKVDGGRPELAFQPDQDLAIFGLVADDTSFYFVTKDGVFKRAHDSSASAPAGLALGAAAGRLAQDNVLAFLERITLLAANGTDLFLTLPLMGNSVTTEVWKLGKAGTAGPADPLAAPLAGDDVSALEADEGGAYVGIKGDASSAKGVSFVSVAGAVTPLYAERALAIALAGDDLFVVGGDRNFAPSLVAIPKGGGAATTVVERLPTSTYQAIAGDATGLYYFLEAPPTTLYRVRRDTGLGTPVVVASNVAGGGEQDDPLALDGTSVYGTSNYGQEIWHVVK
jgi:hypothetical protein